MKIKKSHLNSPLNFKKVPKFAAVLNGVAEQKSLKSPALQYLSALSNLMMEINENLLVEVLSQCFTLSHKFMYTYKTE